MIEGRADTAALVAHLSAKAALLARALAGRSLHRGDGDGWGGAWRRSGLLWPLFGQD